MVLHLSAGKSFMEGSFPVAEFLAVTLMVMLLIVIPAVGSGRVRFILTTVSVVWLWLMVIFVPVKKWGVWVVWLQDHWYAVAVALVVLLVVVLLKKR